MNFLKNLTIKRKLILLIIVVFTISIISVAVYATISFMNSSKKVSLNIAEIINKNYVSNIENEINHGITFLHTISNTLEIKKQDKQYYIDTENVRRLQKLLKTDKNITQLFVVLDNKFKFNKTETSFKTDSLNTYTLSLFNFKDEVEIHLYDESNFIVDFARLKTFKNKNKIVLSNPFNINILENNEMHITIAKPIFKNNKIVGATGINYSLAGIYKLINKVLYYKGTKSILISEKNDIIFVSRKPWLTGKNILTTFSEEQEIYKSLINQETDNRNIEKLAASVEAININNSDTRWEIITVIPYNVLISDFIYNILISILIVSLILLIGLLIVVYIINKSFSPLNKILKVSNKISKGELIEITEAENNNEFEKILQSFNNISKNIKEATDISSEIVKRNYEKRLKPKSDKDILSISINKIAENFKLAVNQNKLQEENTARQLWIRRGRFEVSEAERKSENTLDDLCSNILHSLVNYTDAIMGALFLYNRKKEIIELKSSYAYGKRRHIKQTFKLGESLVGACVAEKKKIILNNVPDDYIKIESGLGRGTPSNITVFPVFYQDKINSVIELAFIKQPENYVIEFIESLTDNIGAWIDASIVNAKTADLLKISQEQTKELEKVQSEIDVQNAEYKSLLNAINHTVMTVEYTLEGIVIKSNAVYEEIMGYSSQDIKGANVLDLVKDQKENLSEIIQQVAKGNAIKRQVKRYTKSGDEKWLSATYTPYYNTEEKITRVLFFANDITEMKLELENLKK